MRAAVLLLIAALAAVAAQPPGDAPAGPTLTLQSGQAVDLARFAAEKGKNGRCCIPVSELGDFSPIVRIDNSGGKFYAAWDKDCKNAIKVTSYPSTFQFIYVCGGAGDDSFDGGLYVGLEGDWCVKEDNTADPQVVCSLAAPVCDAGVTGKCIALPKEATAAVSGPQATLMSGQVVNLNVLYKDFGGECCLPASVLGDSSPIVSLKNSDGKFFVSNDAGCGSPILASSYPATFNFIYVCGAAPSAGCPPGGCYTNVDGGVALLPVGGTCDPYNMYSVGLCFGNSFCYGGSCGLWNNIGVGVIPWLVTPFWRPWRPLYFRPPIYPRPPYWRPGYHPGWRPGQKPNWPSWNQRPVRPVPLPARPGVGGNRPTTLPGTLPTNRPGQGINRPTTLPATRPNMPTTRPAMPTTRPAMPTTRPAMPTTRPAMPTTRPAMPATRPATLPAANTLVRPTTGRVGGGGGLGGGGGRRG
ncbi:hypothetical protein HT031_003159 [Scenedesmus sp. PABB004]|nr:hypothetical protein HT031_003159 [Scenedesmus sp. PABB004]